MLGFIFISFIMGCLVNIDALSRFDSDKFILFFAETADEMRTWPLAEKFCQRRKKTDHLAVIDNIDDNGELAGLAMDSIGPSMIGDVWIGFSDRGGQNEGNWRWVDEDGNRLWTNWDDGEPNDRNGGEDCAALKPDYKWHDIDCQKKLTLWACNKK